MLVRCPRSARAFALRLLIAALAGFALLATSADSATAASRCGKVKAGGLYAHNVKGHRVGCATARRVARRYLRRCRGSNCRVRRYRCRAQEFDFPSPVSCRASRRRKVTFVYDAFP